MVDMIPVSENELKALKESCTVRKRNPFGLSIKEYEKRPYIVNGTYEDIERVLGNIRTLPLPMKILVCLGEET